MKELKTDMQKIFGYENENELYTIVREMLKDCDLGKRIHDYKGFIGTVDMRCFILS